MMVTEGCYRIEAYGGYRLTARKIGDNLVQLRMYDLGNLRFPLMWSTGVTREQADGAFMLFNLTGYFEMPENVREG